MSERFDQLRSRHSQLLARSAVQRLQLGDAAQGIESELGRVDRGIAIVRAALRRPVVIGVGIGIVALLGPRRLLKWAARGLMLYATTRRVARLTRQ